MQKLFRRTFVIDRGFQLKYTVMLMVAGAFISALFGAMMYLVHLDAVRELPSAARAQLADYDGTLLMLTAAVTLTMAVALGLFGVLITHRVAGPVYVMSHYMAVLATGRYPRLRPLRKHDELKIFFDRFSEAVESMRARELEEATRLEEAVGKLSPLAMSDDARAVLAALTAIRTRKQDAAAVLPASPLPPGEGQGEGTRA